jgi:hypothetical protein
VTAPNSWIVPALLQSTWLNPNPRNLSAAPTPRCLTLRR